MQPAALPTSPSPRGVGRSRILSVMESSVAAVLGLLIAWKGLLPAWKNLNTDFPNYYVVARLIRERYCLDRIYDWIWFQRIANHFGVEHQLVGFLGLTPFSALPVLPLAWLPVLEAKRIWIVVNLVMLIGAVELLGRATKLSAGKRWIVALLAFIPLRNNFLFGQMHLLVFALLAVAYVSHMRGRQVVSGSCVALAAALKIYPLFFCLYFLIKGRWKALGTTLLGMAACIGVSYLIAGVTPMQLYLHQQLPRLLQGESQDPFVSGVASSSALFHRLFVFEPELNPRPLMRSPLLFSLLLSLWQALLAGFTLSRMRLGFRSDDQESLEWSAMLALLLGFRSDDQESLEWSAMLALLLVLSSAPATYHFVVLIAAAVPTVAVLVRMGRYKSSGVFLILYVTTGNLRSYDAASNAIDFLTPLRYLRIFAGVALMVYYCFLLSSFRVSKEIRKAWWQDRIGVAVGLTFVLWAVGFSGAWRHQKNLCADCGRRITPADEAFMRTSPQQTSRGMVYVAISADGYRLFRDGESAGNEQGSWDELSFSAANDELWVERAGASSRLSRRVSAASSSCEIDGEEPAVSGDGRSIAFLREERGHGSLWIADVSDCGQGSRPVAATRLTSSAYDVRTLAAGKQGELFISAVADGKERIFGLLPGKAPRAISEDNGDFDSPALSPSGARVAARKLIAGRWQLVSLDISSGAARQLTFADCNAYMPSWKDEHTLLYATDCARGVGLTALAWLRVDR